MSFAERINKIIENQGFSNTSDFSKHIGVSRSTIATVLTSNSTPGTNLILAIISNFENINARWLLTGDGDMILDKSLENSNFYKKQLEEYKELNKHANLIIDVWQKKYEDTKEELEELQKEVALLREQLKLKGKKGKE